MLKRRTSVLISGAVICCTTLFSQCDTTYLTGNQTITSSDFMSGVYYIDGNFKINQGVTVYVQPYTSGGCGKLEIHANNISIKGEINGNFAGFPGGTLGNGGTAVNSLTGNAAALTSCNAKDDAGVVAVEGGKAGQAGQGDGAGQSGMNGTEGSGPKQKCENSSDTYGMIPGAGGAGGGGGASYGGAGTDGISGGNGSATHNSSGSSVSPQYAVLAGNGGTGGNYGNVYGTETGEDIELGSGGAGAGGGGRSFEPGLNGARGGNGGGLVILQAVNDIEIEGTISVNGENGSVGGHAGSGGATDKCCSDGCDDCGEANLSSGAGGGSGAGAGSGGGILIRSESASITGTLLSSGGTGGNGGNGGAGATCTYGGNIFCSSETVSTGNGQNGGKGGDGGGGRIKIFTGACTANQVSPIVSVTGGGTAGEGTYAHICASYLGMEEQEEIRFSIYPNPASQFVTVDLLNTNGEMNTLTLSDTKGATILVESTGNSTVTIPLEGLNNGLYFLTIQSNGRSVTSKIIKQ